MNVYTSEDLAENEYRDQSWNTSKFPDAKKLRDDRARELRKEGWTVKTKKFNFSDLGTGVSYILEASRKREKVQVG
jgi:hypothetical protein